MAKMTKTEAINAARLMARSSAQVNALTVEQFAEMDYYARHALISELMLQSAVSRIDTRDSYIADCRVAFEDEALNVWGRKVKQLKDARRDFKRLLSGMTLDAANAKIVDLLTSMHIRGAVIERSSIEVLRADRDGARLYWTFDREDNSMINPDDLGHRVTRYRLRIEISTGGTSYTPARMAVVLKVQQELLDAAHELEATFARETVVSIWGGKPDEEAPAAPESTGLPTNADVAAELARKAAEQVQA